MTQDSGGSERPQRTVAELLAEYGGNTDGAPRRRRRRAEDDGDSAPQTIIERVLSDSGKLLPIRDDQQQPQQQPRRPGGHRSGERRPAPPPNPAPGPAQQPAPPPAVKPQVRQPTAYSEPVRQQGPPSRQQMPPARPPQQQPQQPAQQPGQQPQYPQSRPAMAPVQQPPAQPVQQQPVQQQPVQQSVPQPKQPVQQPTKAARPVQQPVQQRAQQAIRPQTGQPQNVQQQAVQQPPTVQRPPLDSEQATAVHPKLPAEDLNYPPAGMKQPPTVMQPLQSRLSGMPPEATTEEFPLVPGEREQQQRPGPNQRGGATQLVQPLGQPNRRPPSAGQQTQSHLESTQAHAGPYVDDDYDHDFPQGGVATAHEDDEVFPSRDDYDDDDLDGSDIRHVDSFDETDDEPAGGREWLLMGAQVGAGAIAGAAVWLAFSWLWGLQPVLAVVAALLVIVGLVWGVRRWRRADDLQTTVLAVLAGLVVTVSPAALLLLHR